MVKPPLRKKSIGFKVSEEEYALPQTTASLSASVLPARAGRTACPQTRGLTA